MRVSKLIKLKDDAVISLANLKVKGPAVIIETKKKKYISQSIKLEIESIPS
jgi:hypothetical protein